MKYLVIASLLVLLLLLLYSRIYPYLQFVKKILGVAKTIGTDSPAGSGRNSTAKADRKLVRCIGCGTWIPAARAIGTGNGNFVYCSRECIERSSHDKERKMVG